MVIAALRAAGAEPVAWLWRSGIHDLDLTWDKSKADGWRSRGEEVVALYAAAPAPASVRDAMELLINDAKGAAWIAFARYDRKARRHLFTDDMWKEGRLKQFEAVQVLDKFLSDLAPTPITVERLQEYYGQSPTGKVGGHE